MEQEIRTHKMALIVGHYKKIQEECFPLYEEMMELTDKEFSMVWKAYTRIMNDVSKDPRFKAVIMRMVELDDKKLMNLNEIQDDIDKIADDFASSVE